MRSEPRGVRVALIDSGVNPAHPHVGGVTAAARIVARGGEGIIVERGLEQAEDQIGHGTACAGLVRWFCPTASLVAIRIFGSELRAPAPLVLAALEVAAEMEADVVSLSLGVEEQPALPDLSPALARLTERGALVVAAAALDLSLPWPARVGAILAAGADPSLPQGELGRIDAGAPQSKAILLASPFPRPIPGEPVERNFRGTSFAAAAVAALAARVCLLESTPNAALREEWLAGLVPPGRRYTSIEDWRARRGGV